MDSMQIHAKVDVRAAVRRSWRLREEWQVEIRFL